jgi:hypothetical protein
LIELALDWDDVTAITRKYYMPKFEQAAFDQNLVQKRLHAKGSKPQSGYDIQQPIMYQATKGGFYSPYDTFDVSAEQQITAAVYHWKYLEVPITISRDEILKNKGPEGVKKLMDAKMKLAQMKASDDLATAMFAITTTGTDSSEDIHCLDTFCGDGTNPSTSASGTVGGIAQGTYTWWKGNPFSAGGDGHGPVYQRLSLCFMGIADGNIQPDLIVMHNNAFHSYMSSQQSQQQYYKQNEMDAGFLTASLNGKTVVADLHVSDAGTTTEASNRVYFLNTDFLDFVTHADENMRLEPFAKPVDQAVGVAHIMWAGELTSSANHRHGVLYNVDTLDLTY